MTQEQTIKHLNEKAIKTIIDSINGKEITEISTSVNIKDILEVENISWIPSIYVKREISVTYRSINEINKELDEAYVEFSN